MKKILFVCMGNICRSPAAEAVLNSFITKEGLSDKISCDSAGTTGYHNGQRADERMGVHASKRGHTITSISRQFDPSIDFEEFDRIIMMDGDNLDDIQSLDPENRYKEKISMMTDYCANREETEVPDPYYGGDKGFEKVLDILEDGCEGLLGELVV